MPRLSRPFAALSAAALAALAASAFAGCTQRPTQAPLRSLDRSGRVALFCAGDPRFVDEFGNMGRLMGECGNSFYDDASDFLRDFDGDGIPSNAPHVYAVVTQQTRGEAAVIDLSVDPGLTLSILDADLSTPGLNFLPVGALPADVAASSYGTGAFVASAEPGRPGIYALPTTELRGPEPNRRGYDPANPNEGGAGPTATLRSWPACRLPAAPGRMLLVQSGLPYQARNPNDPGQPADPNQATAHLCPGPNRLREAPVEQPNLYAGDAASVNVTYPGDARAACTAAEPYRCKPALAPPVRLAPELGGQLVTQLAEKLLVTLPDRGELLVIDAQTLFERPAGSFDPCPIERALPLQVALPEVPPFEPEAGPTCPALPGAAPSDACPARPQRAVAYPTEFKARPSAMAFDAERGLLYIADEGAPVIHELELGDGCDLRERQPLLPSSIDQPGRPVYTTALAVSPPTRDERTFLYAVDKERGSVMAFDVSNASLTRSPLERDRTDLNPFGSRDRLALDGPVRDVSFARLQVAVAGDQGNTSTPACSPDTTVVSPGDVYRTRTTDYADGAQPARLRGVFAFATLTTGVVQVVDVDDDDAACRGYRTAPGFHTNLDAPFSELLPTQTACESCAIGAFGDTLGASGELSCQVVERHERRSAFFFANKSATGLHAPIFQTYPSLTFNGATLRTDGTAEARPNPKLLGPAVPNPYYRPGAPVLQSNDPGYDCHLHSPVWLADEDCDPREDAAGNVIDPPLPNPYLVTKPSLEGPWRFERGASFLEGDPSPATAERNFVVPDYREPRAHIDQTWVVRFEGALPGTEGRVADTRLGASEPDPVARGFFDPSATFCATGVHDRAAARLEGARLLGPGADAAALDAFAAQHADFAQIANELLPVEDPYWGSTGGACDYYACEAAYGPASNPAAARDFVIREAYQDRLLVDTPQRVGVPDPDCCFPTLVSYRVRAHNTWTLLGSAVGFQHRTVVDAATGRCVDEGVDPATGAFCDPLLALRNGRAYEAFNFAAPAGDPNAPVLIAGDPRQPCRDEAGRVVDGLAPGQPGCFAPTTTDPIVFRNEVMSFVLYAGEQPSRRDMSFGWAATGGFVPLQVNLNVRVGLVAPFGTAYSPSQERLIVTDGGQSGVFSVNLRSFGFLSYL